MRDGAVVPVSRVELRFEPKPWPFASQRRAEINAYFADLQRKQPSIWNGRVLLMHEHELASRTLRGAYLETDFASFAAWRSWGFPEAGVRNCFGASALISADNALLLGVIGPHTANAGQIYFPCGTPDRKDIEGDAIDLERSALRELAEETGLDAATLDVAPDWTAVFWKGEIAMVKRCRSSDAADVLRRRIAKYLAQEQQPELADIAIIRERNDISAAMPGFVSAYIRHLWP